jgi:predicted negative regulator of RcsB-dependent stress response
VETPRVSVVLASLLSKSEKSADWVAALKLLDDATKVDAAQTGIAELYRGRVFVAQGKKDLAVKTWKAALKRIPATDNAHAQLEQELAKSN